MTQIASLDLGQLAAARQASPSKGAPKGPGDFMSAYRHASTETRKMERPHDADRANEARPERDHDTESTQETTEAKANQADKADQNQQADQSQQTQATKADDAQAKQADQAKTDQAQQADQNAQATNDQQAQAQAQQQTADAQAQAQQQAQTQATALDAQAVLALQLATGGQLATPGVQVTAQANADAQAVAMVQNQTQSQAQAAQQAQTQAQAQQAELQALMQAQGVDPNADPAVKDAIAKALQAAQQANAQQAQQAAPAAQAAQQAQPAGQAQNAQTLQVAADLNVKTVQVEAPKPEAPAAKPTTDTAAAQLDQANNLMLQLMDLKAQEPTTGSTTPGTTLDDAVSIETPSQAVKLLADDDASDDTSSQAATQQPAVPSLNGDRTTVDAAKTAEPVKAQAPARAEDVMPQVLKHMEAVKSNQANSIKLQLYPEHLGKMEIKVMAHQGVLSAQISADNQSVKSMLETQVAALQRTFAELGLKVDKVEVALSSSNLGNDQFGGQAMQQGDTQPQFGRQQQQATNLSQSGYGQWLGEEPADEIAYAELDSAAAVNYVA